MAPTPSSRRLLEAGPYRTGLVVGLAVLVIAAVAIPRYRAAIAGRPPDTVSRPNVPAQVQTQPSAAAARTELSAPTADATPVPDRRASESPSSAPATLQARASDTKVSDKPVARKWNGDWQAATARLNHDAAKAAPGTASSVTPSAAASPVADRASATNAETASPVTIHGCLEISVDEARFRLTDTEGAGVPRARSWRSGFLKKQTATVELLEVGDRATMKKYVGQRVAVTGIVENRDMRVRSLQAEGNRCE